MAERLSQRTELNATPESGDFYHVVDISDPADRPSGTSKFITTVNLLGSTVQLAGRAGGQIINGGTGAGDDLTLSSTSNATKGNIFFGNSTYDEVNNRLGLGELSPTHLLTVRSENLNDIKIIGRASDDIGGLDFSSNNEALSTFIQSNGAWMRTRADGGSHWRIGGTPDVSAAAYTFEGGNVGIGNVVAPVSSLHIKGDQEPAQGAVFEKETAGGVSGIIVGHNVNAGGTDKHWFMGALNVSNVQLRFRTVQDNVGTSPIDILTLLRNGRIGFNEQPSAIFHITNPSDTVSLRADRTTTTVTNSIAEFVSDVTSANTVHCRIQADGDLENTNNAYGAISDVKLKENIIDATPKLSDLLNLSVRHYNLKSKPNEKHIGLIAQELEETFPGLITNTPDVEMIPDPDWEPAPGISQQVQITKKVKVQKLKTTIELIKGKYKKIVMIKDVEEEHPDFDEYPLYDEKGKLLKETHRIPKMKTVKTDGESEADRPMIERSTGTYTKSIKYSLFVPMLIKAIQELDAKLIKDIQKLDPKI